jgi:hypothetical protein
MDSASDLLNSMTDCILWVKNGIKAWLKWHGRLSHPKSASRVQRGALFCAIPILIATRQPVVAQNSASLTIGGVMPAMQRLQISPAPVSVQTSQISVTMNAKDNAGIPYTVTLESKAALLRSNAPPVVYQVQYARQSLTLTTGTVKLVSGGENKSTEAILRISPHSPERNDILLLTLVSQ